MKSKIWKIAVVALAGLVLLAALSSVIYCAVIGVKSFDEGVAAIKAIFIRENDIFYRNSYTVSDRKAQNKREEVVAALPGKTLTNGQLQVGYWMNVYDYLSNYEYYASYAQLDYTQPLDKQACQINGGTWQQYLLGDALNKWHTYHAMSLMAQKEGVTLAPTFQQNLATMEQTMTEQAKQAGYSSLDAMIRADMGPGCTFDDYYAYMTGYYLGYMYYTESFNKIKITEDMIEAYFKEHEKELKEAGITKDSGDLVDIRQIYIRPEGGTEDADGNVVYTDDAWAAARKEALELLEKWEAGKKTESTFTSLAMKYSDNESAESDGGLLESVYQGYLIDELDEWCFEGDHTAGDYAMLQSEYGYYLVYFLDSEAKWHRECRSAVEGEQADKIMENARQAYPMTVDYSKIVLGKVDLTNKKK